MLSKTYQPQDFEKRIYDEWQNKKYFTAVIDKNKKPFTIVIPPPNITGQLHMGHALNNSIQDAIIRFKRMQGFSALYLPGTDHASIATEVKIVEQMAEEGLTKADVGREGFLEGHGNGRKNTAAELSSSLKGLAALATGQGLLLQWTKNAAKR